jgi:hypothetical protein
MFPLGNIMREMICWTLAGRKKLFLVDENNNIIKELRDLGPLSELEMKWVRSNSGMPYKEWLKTLDKEEGEEVAQEE